MSLYSESVFIVKLISWRGLPHGGVYLRGACLMKGFISWRGLPHRGVYLREEFTSWGFSYARAYLPLDIIIVPKQEFCFLVLSRCLLSWMIGWWLGGWVVGWLGGRLAVWGSFCSYCLLVVDF